MANKNSGVNYNYASDSFAIVTQTGYFTTSSTGFVSSGDQSVSLIVPPSGKIRVDMFATIGQTGQGAYATMCPQYSGAFTEAASTGEGINWRSSGTSPGTGNTSCSAFRVLSGMTPGATLTAEAYFKVNAGTGYYKERGIMLTAVQG